MAAPDECGGCLIPVPDRHTYHTASERDGNNQLFTVTACRYVLQRSDLSIDNDRRSVAVFDVCHVYGSGALGAVSPNRGHGGSGVNSVVQGVVKSEVLHHAGIK